MARIEGAGVGIGGSHGNKPLTIEGHLGPRGALAHTHRLVEVVPETDGRHAVVERLSQTPTQIVLELAMLFPPYVVPEGEDPVSSANLRLLGHDDAVELGYIEGAPE